MSRHSLLKCCSARSLVTPTWLGRSAYPFSLFYRSRAPKSLTCARATFNLRRERNSAFLYSQFTLLARSYSGGPRGSANDESAKRPILQHTAEIRKKIGARIPQRLTHENIYTLPNILTFSRLLATPVIGYLILHDAHTWAVGLLFYAGLTDLVDGWIARRWNLQTVVGTVIDPLADKSLMTILTICLAIKGALPVWLATLILGRDVSLAIAAIYYRYASLPPPKTFARYWDFSLPSAEVHPTGISKANTFLQLLLIGAATSMPIAEPAVDALMSNLSGSNIGASNLMIGAQYLVAATTAWSGASYLWTRNAVKILGQRDEASKKRILAKGRIVLAASFASCFGVAAVLENLCA